MFHKITVFSVDATERQKAYMMGSLKKPCQLTILNHISRCKVLNGYIGHLPTLCDSSLAVASTKKGNTPFNEATLASIVLSTCPTDWRNQYKMNHKTVPESTRSMLLNLENIEKVFAVKDGKKTRSIKASAGTAPKKAGILPKNTEREAVLEDQTLRRRHALPRLQVVQGGRWGPSDSRHHQVLQL